MNLFKRHNVTFCKLLSFLLVVVINHYSTKCNAEDATPHFKNNTISCGIDPHFALGIEKNFIAFQKEYCQIFAKVLLNDAHAVHFVELSPQQAQAALESHEIDLYVLGATHIVQKLKTFPENKFESTAPLFFDHVDVLMLKNQTSETFCSLKRENHDDLYALLRNRNAHRPIVFLDTISALEAAFQDNKCQAWVDYSRNMVHFYQASAHEWLGTVSSVISYGPITRQNDETLNDAIKWIVLSLREAEQFNITQDNIQFLIDNSSDLAIHRLLGLDKGLGLPLGIRDTWIRDIILTFGHGDDIFQRHLNILSNKPSTFKINSLWNKGGLFYPIPLK